MQRPNKPPATPYTLQQVFDNVWQHFVIDKRPRSGNAFGCFYAKTGCAIGCMLDAETAETWDNYGPIDAYNIRRSSLYINYFGSISPDVLRDLQLMHDSYFESFETKLREFATKHNLSLPQAQETTCVQ